MKLSSVFSKCLNYHVVVLCRHKKDGVRFKVSYQAENLPDELYRKFSYEVEFVSEFLFVVVAPVGEER